VTSVLKHTDDPKPRYGGLKITDKDRVFYILSFVIGLSSVVRSHWEVEVLRFCRHAKVFG
jgi:hypothetical protein